MIITRTNELAKKLAAAFALAGALTIAPIGSITQQAHAADVSHSTRDDSHPGNGTYNDSHSIPGDPRNRSEPSHAIPANRSDDYESNGGYHDVCAYKPYFYACR